MNPLPLRKKSPEELAKLRENFGIRPPPPGAQAPKGTPNPANGPDGPGALAQPSSKIPADKGPPEVQAKPQSRSFKRTEPSPKLEGGAPRLSTTAIVLPDTVRWVLPERKIDILPVMENNASSLAKHETPDGTPVVHARLETRRPRQAGSPSSTPSWMPVVPDKQDACPPENPADSGDSAATPVAGSQLPLHRHSTQELAQARRRDALAVISQGAYQLPTAAHPMFLACGYLLAIGGAAAPTLLSLLSRLTDSYMLGMAWGHGYHLLTGCSLAALAIDALIYIRNTLSRHHAAFIAIIVFFALFFAVIHYYSQLRHAT
ncbi:MAG: hypothetical protein WCP35_11505 [Verrucomicrobiota bacterium]